MNLGWIVMVYILRTKKFSRVEFWLLFIYMYFLRMHSRQLNTSDILIFLPKARREGIEERILTVLHIWYNSFHILSCHGIKCEFLMWRCGHSYELPYCTFRYWYKVGVILQLKYEIIMEYFRVTNSFCT